MSTLYRAFSHVEVDQSAASLVAPPATTGFLLASMSQSAPLVVVTASSRRAGELRDELETYLGADGVMELPPWETLPHEKLSPKNDTVANRIKVLTHLDKAKVIVTSVRALIQPIAPIEIPIFSIELEQEIPMQDLLAHLTLLGYTRTDLVEKRGDFAVRGGIVDLFLPDQSHPIRIDFFGDQIEDLAWFTVADQRTFEPVQGNLDISLEPILKSKRWQQNWLRGSMSMAWNLCKDYCEQI